MSASSEPDGERPQSRGSRKVVLPEVCGLDLRNAEIVLRQAGLEHVRVHYTEDYANEFEVVQQAPRSGQLVDRDREVVLYIARESLIQYLPQIYQQTDSGGTDFLRGFLYIIQHVLDHLVERLDRVHELFDPQTTDPDFLPWLASWLAITLNSDWDDLQRRKMLLAATRLFPYRGTSYAIQEFVRIYTGAEVSIEENTWPFSGFRIGANSSIGEDAVVLPTMNLAHCFVVHLDRPASEVPDEEIIRIHEIIQAQKPAHTTYFLSFRDEEEAGEMGTFMEVGAAPIGVAPEEVPEAAPAEEAAASEESGETEPGGSEGDADAAERSASAASEPAEAEPRDSSGASVESGADAEASDEGSGASEPAASGPDSEAGSEETSAAASEAAEDEGGGGTGKSSGSRRRRGSKKSRGAKGSRRSQRDDSTENE